MEDDDVGLGRQALGESRWNCTRRHDGLLGSRRRHELLLLLHYFMGRQNGLLLLDLYDFGRLLLRLRLLLDEGRSRPDLHHLLDGHRPVVIVVVVHDRPSRTVHLGRLRSRDWPGCSHDRPLLSHLNGPDSSLLEEDRSPDPNLVVPHMMGARTHSRSDRRSRPLSSGGQLDSLDLVGLLRLLGPDAAGGQGPDLGPHWGGNIHNLLVEQGDENHSSSFCSFQKANLARWRSWPFDRSGVDLVVVNHWLLCDKGLLVLLLMLLVMRFSYWPFPPCYILVIVGHHVRIVRLKVVVAVAAGGVWAGNGDHDGGEGVLIIRVSYVLAGNRSHVCCKQNKGKQATKWM